MNYLIIYMSHHGTTQKVVHELREKLGSAETSIINLEKDSVRDLSGFKTIIVGGSIHMGQIQKPIKKFCDDHKQELLKHHLGLFLCFMNKEEGKKEFEGAYSQELREHASAHGLFGGEFLFNKMNFIEKMITRKVSGVKENVSALDEDAIESFARSLELSGQMV